MKSHTENLEALCHKQNQKMIENHDQLQNKAKQLESYIKVSAFKDEEICNLKDELSILRQEESSLRYQPLPNDVID